MTTRIAWSGEEFDQVEMPLCGHEIEYVILKGEDYPPGLYVGVGTYERSVTRDTEWELIRSYVYEIDDPLDTREAIYEHIQP